MNHIYIYNISRNKNDRKECMFLVSRIDFDIYNILNSILVQFQVIQFLVNVLLLSFLELIYRFINFDESIFL